MPHTPSTIVRSVNAPKMPTPNINGATTDTLTYILPPTNYINRIKKLPIKPPKKKIVPLVLSLHSFANITTQSMALPFMVLA